MLTLDGKPILVDDAKLGGLRTTREGYLVAEALAARSGIYTYLGSEVGMSDRETVRVYRPVETVFDKNTLRSFTSLDVTNGHPPELVDATNWRKYAVGSTSEEVARDGEYVRVQLIVRDKKTVDEVNSGTRGLSFGYTCDLDPTPGRTPEGEEYDAVQRNLLGNHLAIVPSGRAGSACRIGDDQRHSTGAPDMPGENPTLKTVLVDGIPIQTTDAAATVIDTLQSRVKRASEDNLKLVSDHGAEIKERDAEIARLSAEITAKSGELGARDAEIKTLKDAAADQATLDARVAERAEIVTGAKALGLSDEEARGKSNDDLIRLAVSKRMGDEAVKDKDASYVRGAFDLLSRDADHGHQGGSSGVDPVAEAVRRSGILARDQRAEDPHARYVVDLKSAWKNPNFGPDTNRAN